MIAIIGAMETEIAALREIVGNKKKVDAKGFNIVCGKVADKDVIVCRCGIGKVYAAAAASFLLARYPVSKIINLGVAGGISPKTKRLDVVIGDKTIQHDFDLTAAGYKKGQLDSLNKGDFFSDKSLVDTLCDIAAKTIGSQNTHVGTIVTGDKFVASKADCADLHTAFNALACDMESAAIAHVAEIYGVPFASLRSISDGADDDACEDFDVFEQKAADISVKIISKFLTGK